MAEKKASWDDIPSLDNLEVDWDFKPENPLGDRKSVRLEKRDLVRLLGENKIPVKLLLGKQEVRALLDDLSESGAALLIDRPIEVGTKLAVGFFLGQSKIIGRCEAKNNASVAGNYRVGVAFTELSKGCQEAIKALTHSKTLGM